MVKKPSLQQSGLEEELYAIPVGTVFRTYRRAEGVAEAHRALAAMDNDFSVVRRHKWPDFFCLEELKYGAYFCHLDGRLADRFERLTANMDDQKQLTRNVLRQLNKLGPQELKMLRKKVAELCSPSEAAKKEVHPSMMLSVELVEHLQSVINLVRDFKAAIGPDLHIMYIHQDIQRERAAERLNKAFKSAVSTWNDIDPAPKAHGHAKKYPCRYLGREIQAPVPWLAIEFARRFVLEKRELPKKADVRAKLISEYPELKSKQDNFWSEVYQKAGLSDLDAAKPWAAPKPRRRMSGK